MEYCIYTDDPRFYIRAFREMIETSLQREGFIGLVGGARESKADMLGKVQAYQFLLRDTARIILCAQNSVEWICIFRACVLDEKKLFILDAHIDRKKLRELSASVQAELVITDEEADPRDPVFCSIGQLPFRTRAAEAAVGTGKVILYTTGTTGSPKGVEVMLPGMVTNLVSFQKLLRLERCENALLTTAFSHAMGLIGLLTALCYGGNIFVTQNEMQILYGIMHEDVQFMTVPPVFMNMLKTRTDYVEKLKSYRRSVFQSRYRIWKGCRHTPVCGCLGALFERCQIMLNQEEGLYKVRKTSQRLRRHEELDVYYNGDRTASVSRLYLQRIGKPLRLNPPVTFNEKLQWMKLNWRDPLAGICANKYTMRDYVVKKGFGHLLHPLLAVWQSAEEIDFSALPDSFIIKAAHTSGMNLSVQDKHTSNIADVRNAFRGVMDMKYYAVKHECVYEPASACLICESLFQNTGARPLDYKFFALTARSGRSRCSPSQTQRA